MMFVRSITLLGEYSPQATGLKISTEELEGLLTPEFFDLVVREIKEQAYSFGLNARRDIQCEREKQGLTINEIHDRSGVPSSIIRDIEGGRFVSIHEVKKVCDALGLDVRTVGFPKTALKETGNV